MSPADSHQLAVRVLDGFLEPADLEGARLEWVGRYQVLELLGEGAAGEVYRARDSRMERDVAVKLIKAGPSEERLQQELRTLARLDHPGVVSVFDAGFDHGRPFFVMAYVGGTTLAAAELDLEAWVSALEKVLFACDYVHEQGVVHRDLKPENILLDAEGEPAIADFGIAKLLEADKHLTRTGAILGTPAYMAPEQVQGGAVGPAADVYAAGAMLYERLCGALPVEVPSLLAFCARMASDEPVPPPTDHEPTADPELSRIALRALARNPSERFPSARAMAEALRRWRRGESSSETEAGRQAPLLLGALGLLLLIVVGSGLGLLSGATPVEDQTPPTNAPADVSALSTVAPAEEPSPPTRAESPPAAVPPAAPERPRGEGAMERWAKAPPGRDELQRAFSEIGAELPTGPSREEARRFARVCWATMFRVLDEAWTPPGEVPALVALSKRAAQGAEGWLVVGNAFNLRWWFERDAEGKTQSRLFEQGGLAVKRAVDAGYWEADATVLATYALALRNNAGRWGRRRFILRTAAEPWARYLKRVPKGEEALTAELTRRVPR